jgi:hypothetical protein
MVMAAKLAKQSISSVRKIGIGCDLQQMSDAVTFIECGVWSDVRHTNTRDKCERKRSQICEHRFCDLLSETMFVSGNLAGKLYGKAVQSCRKSCVFARRTFDSTLIEIGFWFSVMGIFESLKRSLHRSPCGAKPRRKLHETEYKLIIRQMAKKERKPQNEFSNSKFITSFIMSKDVWVCSHASAHKSIIFMSFAS